MSRNVCKSHIIIDLDTLVKVPTYSFDKLFKYDKIIDIKRTSIESDYVVPIPYNGMPDRTFDGFLLGVLGYANNSQFLIIGSKEYNALFLSHVVDGKIDRLITISKYYYCTNTNYCHIFTKRKGKLFKIYEKSLFIDDECTFFDKPNNIEIKPSLLLRFLFLIKDCYHRIVDNKKYLLMSFQLDDSGISFKNIEV